jgi:hypothetical protein
MCVLARPRPRRQGERGETRAHTPSRREKEDSDCSARLKERLSPFLPSSPPPQPLSHLHARDAHAGHQLGEDAGVALNGGPRRDVHPVWFFWTPNKQGRCCSSRVSFLRVRCARLPCSLHTLFFSSHLNGSQAKQPVEDRPFKLSTRTPCLTREFGRHPGAGGGVAPPGAAAARGGGTNLGEPSR